MVIVRISHISELGGSMLDIWMGVVGFESSTAMVRSLKIQDHEILLNCIQDYLFPFWIFGDADELRKMT